MTIIKSVVDAIALWFVYGMLSTATVMGVLLLWQMVANTTL